MRILFIEMCMILIFGVLGTEVVSNGVSVEIDFDSMPTLPSQEYLSKFRSLTLKNVSYQITSPIPRVFWYTTKNVSELQPVYYWIPKTIERNPDWQFHIADDDEMESMMNSLFAGTQVLWAFNKINKAIPPARADVWRYATLWVYGGGYMDTDSDIRTPLNKVISGNHSFIFGAERRNRHQCYYPGYHLHEDVINAYNASCHISWFAFNQNIIFSTANHPFLRRTLENLVEIVRKEYLGESPTYSIYHSRLNQEIICTTGPMMFTFSVMEEACRMVKNGERLDYLFTGHDFKIFDASMKVIKARDIPNHYHKTVFSSHRKKAVDLLNEYRNKSNGRF